MHYSKNGGEIMSEFKKEYWGKFAQTFSDDQKYIVGEAVQVAIFNKLAKEREIGEAIELGCGAGFFSGALAKNAKHLIATDFSDEMLAIAKTQLKEFRNITVQKADCENTSFPSGKFDTVFMVNLLHVIENPHKCLAESHRILKPGGLLLVIGYTSHSMKLLKKIKLMVRFMRKWGKPPRYFEGKMSPDKLKALVKNVGFEVDEVQILGAESKALYLKGRKK
jgi:ABC-2 type transport system ATP-binding protein